MRVWNVNVFWSPLSNEDLGTYTDKAKAIVAAHEEMDSEAWHISYQTENEIHFSNGPATLIIESIYVG